MIEVKVLGLEELKARLRRLPAEMQQGPVKGAIGAAGRVVQKEAKLRAPVRTGTLKRAIYVTRSKSLSTGNRETAIVGVRSGKKYQKRKQDAWYWRFVEFGIPQMGAQPFLRPAFEGTKTAQIRAFKVYLEKGLDRVVKKLGGR